MLTGLKFKVKRGLNVHVRDGLEVKIKKGTIIECDNVKVQNENKSENDQGEIWVSIKGEGRFLITLDALIENSEELKLSSEDIIEWPSPH